MIFDSHAHYDDTKFDEVRDELLSSLPALNVCGIINCAVNYKSARACIELAEKYSHCFAAVGVHPEDLYKDKRVDKELLSRLCEHKKVVAIGEIGLDYHWDLFERPIQKMWLVDQIELAKELDMPVILHDRDAHGDMLEILKLHRPKGVLHCFSGSAEMAEEVLKLDLYIGIGGVVTFKNARKTVEVVKMLPLGSLLLETDAPYLAPEPYRGKICRSDYIDFTAAKVAEIKGISKEAVLAASLENSKALFNITL